MHSDVPLTDGSPTPPHFSPASGDVSLAANARGGHPEQRERGGGWGADLAGSGRPGVPGPSAPAAGGGRLARGAPVGAPGHGPREEYLDAFDRGTFAVDAVRPGEKIPGPSRGDDHDGPAGGGGGGDDGDSPDPDAPGPRHEKGGKVRTLTGVAAAAVITVLAVLVAGQVTGGDAANGGPATGTAEIERGDAGDTAARSGKEGGDVAPQPSPSPKSYAQKLAEPFELDPDLKGSGRFEAIDGHEKGPGGAREYTYRVDVEKGLPLDGELFAEAVQKSLNDKRSWAYQGQRSFERVSSGRPDFVITLASPGTTDVWCAKSGLDTSEQKVSCDSAATERIMINGYRWARGASTFGLDEMRSYRQMLINHEVGHRIGLGHVGCNKDNALAPVMMQQTKSLKTGAATCRPNAWAHPEA